MSSTEAVQRLVEGGVFEAVDDELHPTESFQRAVESHRQTLADRDADGRREAIIALTGDEETADALSSGAVTDPELLARYVALRERDGALSASEALALAVVVGQFEKGQPRAEGAPSAFLPVDGEDLERLVGLYDRCVVYAWREDCPPCDTIRADLDDLFPGPPGDMLLLSVYGPDCPRLLDREFDVVGAPTLLFTFYGQVDSRLVGAPTKDGIRAEIETLRQRTPASAE